MIGEKTKDMSFANLRARGKYVLKTLNDSAQGVINKSSETKPLGRLFTMKEVEQLVGKSRTTILKLQSIIESKIISAEYPKGYLRPLVKTENGRVSGYQLEWVEAFRREADVVTSRDPSTDEPFTLAVIQFKGGAGKTETASNLSRKIALTGKSVLVIDMDHQGSCTGSFGFCPDEVFTGADTVMPYIAGEKDSLDYAIIKTAWNNIDLIPGCMDLENFNWSLAEAAFDAETPEERLALYDDLKFGIETVKENYDVVIIDSPPSSSISAFGILAAADGLVIPVPPRKHDLASTIQFLGILERLIEGFEKDGEQYGGVLKDKKFKFVRFLVTQYTNDGNRSSNDKDFLKIFKEAFAHQCYELVFRNSSNIKEASAQFTSVYEVNKPNKPLLKELDQVLGQIETDIMRHWPSKKAEVIERDAAFEELITKGSAV